MARNAVCTAVAAVIVPVIFCIPCTTEDTTPGEKILASTNIITQGGTLQGVGYVMWERYLARYTVCRVYGTATAVLLFELLSVHLHSSPYDERTTALSTILLHMFVCTAVIMLICLLMYVCT